MSWSICNTFVLLYWVGISTINIAVWYLLWQRKKDNERRIYEVRKKFQLENWMGRK